MRQQNQTSDDWFFLFEHNAIPAGSVVWIQPVSVIAWEYRDTYETYPQAVASAEDWEALMFETDIRAVYGGPLPRLSPRLSPLMPGIAPRGFASDLAFFRWLDD